MNARSNTFEIKCAGHQINDAVSAIFHSIIFYRTTGKVNYKDETSYSVGSIGYEDVQCDFIDFSFVRCASPGVISSINCKIREFVERLRDSKEKVGTVSLEFYKKKKNSGVMGFFTDSNLVWEIWNIKVICDDNIPSEALNLEEILLDKVITIIQIVNGNRCSTPQMPDRDNVDAFFDVTFDDAQPYLHRINHRIGDGSSASSTNSDLSFKKLIKDALAL